MHQSTDITGLTSGGISLSSYERITTNTSRNISDYTFILALLVMTEQSSYISGLVWAAGKIDNTWITTTNPSSNTTISVNISFTISDDTLTITQQEVYGVTYTFGANIFYFK